LVTALSAERLTTQSGYSVSIHLLPLINTTVAYVRAEIVTIATVAVLLASGVERIAVAAIEMAEIIVTVPATKGSVAISIFI